MTQSSHLIVLLCVCVRVLTEVKIAFNFLNTDFSTEVAGCMVWEGSWRLACEICPSA